MSEFIVSTFYKFVELQNFEALKPKLIKVCNDNKIKGTILLASEGINATITGDRNGLDNFYEYLRSIKEFAEFDYKESDCEFIPFQRLKVKAKKEIVTFKEKLNMQQVGERVDSTKWDDLISDPNTIVIDTRNDYEVVFGTFKNAINPKTRNFTDLVTWVKRNLKEEDKDKNIAMFCTGGVRCEKSTSYLAKLGFKKVFHLKGGILQYFLDTKNASQNWLGKCFVFDDRIAVDPEYNYYKLQNKN
jgi:UPF0176 protein